MGIRSNCTMLYGHVEKPFHRVDHLVRLRELQDETGGFQTFIPLAFHPDNTRLAELEHLRKPSVLTDLRVLAISRLMLDNFAHVKGYWIMITPRLAQLSLSFGVSDMDGTVVEEKIYHNAGARTEQGMTRNDLAHLIRAAGKVPVERDALYNEIEVYA
jgi:aminodeoxyfutalosine synthase